MTTTSAFPGSHPDRACQKDTESEGDAGDDTISVTSPLNDPAALTVLSYHFAIASPRPFRHAPEHFIPATALPDQDSVQASRDHPLVVGAVVRRPQADGRADGAVAHAVQGGAGAPVDDPVAAVARAVEPPLLVGAAVPGCLPGGGAVGGVAPAVGDHGVGAVDDAVPAVAQFDELPLQVGAAVPVPLFEVRSGGDVPAAVQHQAGGRVGDPHVAGGRGAGPGHAVRATGLAGQPDDVVLGFGDGDGG